MLPIQCSIQPTLYESPSYFGHCVLANSECFSNLSVRPVRAVLIHFQQLLRVSNLSCASPTLSNQSCQSFTLILI